MNPQALSRRNFLQLSSSTLGALLLSGCVNNKQTVEPVATGSTITESGLVSAETLAQQLPDKSFTLINVHYPYTGEIEQTDSFIPFDSILSSPNLPTALDAPIVLYCESGGMSAAAAADLVAAGYTNVRDLNGGLRAWQQAGYTRINNQ